MKHTYNKFNSNCIHLHHYLCEIFLSKNYGVDDLKSTCGRCMSKLVDVIQLESPISTGDIIEEKDTFNALVDSMHVMQLENNYKDEIKKSIAKI